MTSPSGNIKIVADKVTGGAVVISFNEPEDLGGARSGDIIYQVFVDRDNVANLSYSPSSILPTGFRRLGQTKARRLETTSSGIVNGLDPSSLYNIQIRPINAAASGTISSGLSTMTSTATPPSAPNNLKGVAVSGGSVSLQWSPPDDMGGLPILQYTVIGAGNGLNLTAEITGGLTNTIVYDLLPATEYIFEVYASNEVGDSPSVKVSVRTTAVTSPSSPRDLTITSVTFDQVFCEWNPPADNGGDTVMSYVVMASSLTTLGSVLTTITTNTQATISGLQASVQYGISVMATNSMGMTSVKSMVKYATIASSASTPSMFLLQSVSQSSATLMWYAYAGASEYRILRNGSKLADVGITTSFTDEYPDLVDQYFEYSVQVFVGGTWGPESNPVSVTPDLFSLSKANTFCLGSSGQIAVDNYTDNVVSDWHIAPDIPYSGLVLMFERFDLECDHDFIEILDAESLSRLWKGGCYREGLFTYQTNGPVIVRFSSDQDVSGGGFSFIYATDSSFTESVIAAPGGHYSRCSKHGQAKASGTCKCNVGFTGEDCSNRIVCCSDSSRCSHPVCDIDPANVIVVDTDAGEDSRSGAMMNASETGTASKAVRTLSKALSISREDSYIFIYPGTYSGSMNRMLNIAGANLTIQSLKGSYWTTIDCSDASQALYIDSSALVIGGITFRNCSSSDGGTIKILSSELHAEDVAILGSSAGWRGGGITTQDSTVYLSKSYISHSTSGEYGGGIHAINSTLTLDNANVTSSSSTDGGAIALIGSSVLIGIESASLINNEAENSGGAILVDTMGSDQGSIRGVLVDLNRASIGGGIVINPESSLELEDVVISNNYANYQGGGIAMSRGSSLQTRNVSIQMNRASREGGGIYGRDMVEIRDSQVGDKGTILTNNTAYAGGGIYLMQANAKIYGMTIEGGSAFSYGGGLAAVRSSVTLSSLTLQFNNATSGGAIAGVDSSFISKSDVAISQNTATNGGGLSLDASSLLGNKTVCNQNSASDAGGCIFVNGDTFLEALYADSNAAARGGGVATYGSRSKLIFKDIDIVDSIAYQSGGGIWIENAFLNFSDSRVRSSEALLGGGVYSAFSTIVGNFVIDNCRAENDGGGMYLTGASSLVYAHVSNSMAHRGGALFVSKASVTLEHVVMTSSTASQDGGGLYSTESSIWLSNITLLNHTSLESGGGVFLMDSAVVHNNVTIAGGQSRNGGGVYMIESTFEGSNFDYETTVISQNSASESGGNVYIHSLKNGSILADTEIRSGRAAVDGGGLKIFDGYVIIRNCQVTENMAPTGGGLSIVGGSECRMTNVDISNNNGSQQGGGMSLDNSTLLHDTVQLSYNSAPLGGAIFSAGEVVVDFATSSVGANNISRPLMLIESNTAKSNTEQSGYGGSLYVSAESYTIARGLDVYRSRADKAGGGIYVKSSKLRLSNSQISQCNSSDGGALFIKDKATVDVFSCLLAQNYASDSGGAISATSSENSVHNEIRVLFSTFESNVADINGGAISLENTNMDGTHNVLINNMANQGSGGAIASLGTSVIHIFGWEFYNNTVGDVNGQFGGTIYLEEDVESSISDSVILSNSEATLVRYGGLIYIQGPSSSLSVIGSRLGLGQAYYGGAIYAVDASVLIQNTTIDTGFAFEFGGGIFAQNVDLRVTDSSIVNNFAYYSGGAIFMKAGGRLEMLNSVIDLNAVQDSGGAIYLASGAEITSEITDTALTRNSNYGYGSVIYVGRKNEIVLTRCTVSYNGGQSTEAGALYLIDGIGTVRYTTFEQNSAVTGAAIAIARDGKLILADSTLKNNSATSAGGALYGSVRAVASVVNTNIEKNSAIEGGAVFATGSSKFEFRGVRATHNLARSFGGAFSFRGMASLKVTASQIYFNGAYTGGGISLDENTSSVITTSDFGSNSATDFGGAIYINRLSKVSTKSPMTCTSLQFDTNDAAAGSDIFWVFHPWFVLNCDDCHLYTGENANIATSATTITAGWWPEAVTSGVKLSANKIRTNSTLINGRRLGDSSSQKTEITNAENSNPALDTLWPTMVVRDYYGVIASQDNRTMCIAHVSNDENDTFSFVPSGWVAVSNGYITFENAEILSISRTKPYTLNVECSLSSDVGSGLSINITVERCLAGYENVDGLCLSCEKGKYSLDGWKCYLCPLGATCEMTDEDGTTVGVGVPTREDGYFLSESRETLLKSSCVNPSLWATGDPCKEVVGDSLSEQIYRCSSLEGFESYWNRKRIFACISGMEYYGCDTYDACVKDNSTLMASQLSTSSLTSSFNVADQCDLGYVGIMCATCDDEYYRVSNGSCRPCKDPKDPAVARMTRLLTVIPIAYALLGFAVVCYFFYDASEKDILKYARAAKKFQLYGPDSERSSILRSVQFYTQERVSRMVQTMRASIPTRRQRVWLFGIAPVALPTPGFRAEKFKILLGFFQVFGGFKRTYEIPWPDDMNRLLDVYSIVDFNFIDTTSVECFYRRNYFASYRLALFAVLVLLMVTVFLLGWGSVRYRVVLSTLPRHCVKCGLPVFHMLHRVPQTLVKRATKVSMLKMQQKKHMSDSFMKQSLGTRMKANLSSRAEDAFNSAKHWVSHTRFGQSVMRIALKTRLPASSAEHKASCPTSHRISNDVQAMVVRSNIRLWRARIRLRLNYKTYQNRCIKLLFWILLLFYPDLSARVIGIFYCEEIGPYYYLTRDRRFRCYEGEWLAYLPLSIVLILFWVIGVPLLFWLILFIKRRHGVADTLVLLEDPSNIERKERLLVEVRRDLIDRGKKVDEDTIQLFESEMLAEYLRSRKLQEPTVIAQVGFIYHAYDARFWWFEVWDLGRKLFLNCVVGLLASTAANRMISGLVVLLVYLSVMLFFQPYKFQSDSALAGITQIQLFITLFCGLILKLGSHTLEDSVILLLTYTAFATNVCTIAYGALSIIHERYISLRQVQRQVRENHRRAIQLHVRKLWRRAYGYAFTEVYLRDMSIRPMPVHVFLEIARRDRAARENAELEENLERTVPHLEGSPQKPDSESTVERAVDELQQSS